MREKLLAFALIFVIAFGGMNVVSAAESVSTVKVDADGKLATENINLDAFEGIAPGDSRVQKIAIKNESEDTYDFYLLEETIKALEETNKSAGGAYKFDIRVGTSLDNSDSLLTKEVGGYSIDGNASASGLSDVDELEGYTYMAELNKAEATYLFICLEVLGEGNDNSTTTASTVEGSNGLGYTNAIGELKLSFKIDAPKHQGETQKKIVTKTVEKVKKVTVKKYVKTGDSVMLFVFGGIFLLGIVILIVAMCKSKKAKKNISLILVLACLLAFIPNLNVKAASTITVTFRSGESGSFEQSIVSSLANSNVEATADYIRITVPKATDGNVTLAKVIEAGFGTTDIDGLFGRITRHENVALLSAADWNANMSEVIKHNKEYVLKYGVLVDPVMYTVRFMDVSSYDESTDSYTQEIAAPIINYGNAGDVVTVNSAVVNDFATTEESFTFTLSKDVVNIHNFYYAYTGEGDTEEEVTYETRYKYLTEEQIVVINDAADNNPNNGNANADDTNNDNDANGNNADGANDGANDDADAGQQIDDDNVPAGANPNGDDAEITDDDTPLGPGADSNNGFAVANIIIVSCIAAIIVFIIAITIFVIYKRKRQI